VLAEDPSKLVSKGSGDQGVVKGGTYEPTPKKSPGNCLNVGGGGGVQDGAIGSLRKPTVIPGDEQENKWKLTEHIARGGDQRNLLYRGKGGCIGNGIGVGSGGKKTQP